MSYCSRHEGSSNAIALCNSWTKCWSTEDTTFFWMGRSAKHASLMMVLPQGSMLAPLLFNNCIGDLTHRIVCKFIYADNITLMVQGTTTISNTLSADLKIMEEYLQSGKLCSSTSKTLAIAFQLNNKATKIPLNVTFCRQWVWNEPYPKYLSVTLGRSLTFKAHLEKLCENVKATTSLVQKLMGTT